jgi:lipoprotein Spr/probable lipoprotein NlpC
MRTTFTLSILFLLLLTACSSKQKDLHPLTYHLHKKNFITQELLKNYKRWEGTPYCYGGEDTHGIDCSALVQTIYKEAFNIQLPRTTTLQMQMGKAVSKGALQEGDLIFFQTSFHSFHSAIYLEDGLFIHASSKHGVTLSNINNPYWRAHYYQARRLLVHNNTL